MRDKILVTGAAGFIGSHLCETLAAQGYQVIGIDNFNEPRGVKEKNIADLCGHPGFRLIEGDLLELELPSLLDGVNVIYHLAATPGVRSSWGNKFNLYVQNNIRATQFLLEAAVGRRYLKKFILASTSSVYGSTNGPTAEDYPARPMSPYGVTKLAAEHLAAIYQREFALPLSTLRFFTVYGPRQRPDMAFHRLIKAALSGTEFRVYGDGSQIRDFTYIEDIVKACVQTMSLATHGGVFNLGGNSRASLNNIITLVEELCGCPVQVTYEQGQPGEPKETWADISQAARHLKYNPATGLREGIKTQIQYIRSLYGF